MKEIRVLMLGVALCLATATHVFSASCKELRYGNPDYQNHMDALAAEAQLAGATWNQNHETVVASFCGGKESEIDALVDGGFVSATEVVRIAAALGKTYRPKLQSTEGMTYESVRQALIEIGICAACADNIAQHFTQKPESACAKLARRALNGDTRAEDELQGFPDECKWVY